MTAAGPQAPGDQGGKARLRGERKSSRRKVLWIAGVVALTCWSLAVAGGAFWGGWQLQEYAQAQRQTEGPTVIEVPAEPEVAADVAPDIRGLSLGDAKQALVDSGVDPATFAIEEVAWAGNEGVVIRQDPVVGEPLSETMTLTVSVPASMPAAVGLHRDAVIASLREFGVETELEETYDLSVAAGTVLDSVPAEGEPLPEVVTLTVAQPGSSLFFDALRPVESICRSAEARLDGQLYVNSLDCRSGNPEQPAVGVWLLDRRGQQLTGTIGVDDTGETDATASVRIIGNGTELAAAEVSYATPAAIDIDISGILRLEIWIASETRSSVMLGDVLVKGTSADIDRLEAE